MMRLMAAGFVTLAPAVALGMDSGTAAPAPVGAPQLYPKGDWFLYAQPNGNRRASEVVNVYSGEEADKVVDLKVGDQTLKRIETSELEELGPLRKGEEIIDASNGEIRTVAEEYKAEGSDKIQVTFDAEDGTTTTGFVELANVVVPRAVN